MIHNLKNKIKDLWTKARYKLIEVLGGYTFPPVSTQIKAEPITTVPVTASLMVNKGRYDTERAYRVYVKEELTRILADYIFAAGVLSNETVVELNDNEYIVKVSAKLVKEDK